MKDIQQLIKKNSQEGRYEDIFPKTFTDAVNKDFASIQLNSKPSQYDLTKGEDIPPL